MMHERALGLLVDLGGRPDLLHPTLGENDHAVGKLQCLLLVVRHEHRGDMDFLMELTKPAPQLLADLGIERAERFVEQQHFRFDGQRPGERHALALPSGQLGRVPIAQIIELHELEQFVHPPANLGFRGAMLARPHAQAEGNVLEDRHVAEECVMLENESHAPIGRAALGRVVAVEPKVLLLDEPFGALDANVRRDLRRWLRRLHDEIHLTSVFVTHDQEEALELADRVVVMNEGRIEQDGTPEAVVEQPATPFVMTFVGEVNIFHGRVQDGKAHLGPLAVDYPAYASEQARQAVGYARPHELELSRSNAREAWPMTVRDVRVAGAVVKVEVTDQNESAIQVELGREQYELLRLAPGEKVYVTPRHIRIFTSD